MSFSIDLWNGFNSIKDRYNSIRKELRSFSTFLSKYNTCETQHCKNLDNLYNEFKEQNVQNKTDFELARINLIDMINFESQKKKIFLEDVNKLVKKINLFLQDLKSPTNEISELTENFNKDIEKLNLKKESFYSKCKEMSSFISQFELENKLKDKNNEAKLSKELTKLIKTRDEYLISINETNIKRSNYNNKVEELMDKYEKDHRELLNLFYESVNEFKTKKYQLSNELSTREKSDFLNLFSKLSIDKEITEFIIKNITKDFPMVQIEFAPFKKKDFEVFLNSKYHNKLKSDDLKKVMNAIKNYFQNNNVFPLNFIQTGISRYIKQKKENFLNVRKFSIFMKYNNNNEISSENTGDKNWKEKEIKIIKNYEFVKNVLNELVTDNKIQIFESKYVIEGDIPKNKDEDKKLRDINDKIKELKSLLDQLNENHLVYIEALIKTLSYLRSKGCFEIKDLAYNVITDSFKLILEQNPNNDYILKNILILAQTFYKNENMEKIYIQEGIRGNPVLNSPKTWHRCINFSLKISNKDLKVNADYIDKINKDAYATVITYLCDLKAFTDDEKVFNDVAYFYRKVYNLKEEDVKNTVEKSVKSRQKKKEEEAKKNEIKLKKEKEESKSNNEDKNEIKEIKLDDNVGSTPKENDKNEIKEIKLGNNINHTPKENDKNEIKEIKFDNNADNTPKENDKNEIKETSSDNNKNVDKNEIIINDNEINTNKNNNDNVIEQKNDKENNDNKK